MIYFVLPQSNLKVQTFEYKISKNKDIAKYIDVWFVSLSIIVFKMQYKPESD